MMMDRHVQKCKQKNMSTLQSKFRRLEIFMGMKIQVMVWWVMLPLKQCYPTTSLYSIIIQKMVTSNKFRKSSYIVLIAQITSLTLF